MDEMRASRTFGFNSALNVPGATVNSSPWSGGGGNPDLDPYESNNYDFSAEWYFNENSILAGTVFYKDVSNYILYTTSPEVHFNQSTNTDTTAGCAG